MLENIILVPNIIRITGWTCVVAAIIMYLLTMRRDKKRLVGYVSGLRTYPVKSCAPVRLENVEINKLGLIHDRQYILVNEYKQMIKFGNNPRFAFIQPHIKNDCILVEAPGMSPLKLPLSMRRKDGEHCSDVTVLRITMPDAVHVSDEADAWFAQYMGFHGCKLYSYPIDGTPRFAMDKGVKVHNYTNEQDTCMFSNGTPLLLLSNPSVESLNKMINEEVTVENFRPNIIISQCEPFAEDNWSMIEINDVRLQALYPQTRCPSINVNPDTADVNKNILEEVKRARPADDTYPKISRGCIGMNYGVRNIGKIKIGDPIYALN